MHVVIRGNVFNRNKLSSHISVKDSVYVKFHAVDIFACRSQYTESICISSYAEAVANKGYVEIQGIIM